MQNIELLFTTNKISYLLRFVIYILVFLLAYKLTILLF